MIQSIKAIFASDPVQIPKAQLCGRREGVGVQIVNRCAYCFYFFYCFYFYCYLYFSLMTIFIVD